MAKNAKAPAIVSEINVTPMVDVMLVLLIIFMVVTPLISRGSVNLVETWFPIAMKGANAEDAIIVAVTRSGEVFLSPGNSRVALDEMSGKVATFYEAEVDNAVDAMSSLLEPLIMVVLGVLVGGLVIAMYLPIFKLGSVV